MSLTRIASFSLLVLLIDLHDAGAQKDESGFPIPKTLREKLNSEVYPGDAYVRKPETQAQRDWKWGRGRNNLSKAEVEATKQIINSAKCEFQYYDGTAILATRTRLPEPSCPAGDKTHQPLMECAGTVKCTSPGMKFWVVSHCFVRGEQPCPAAQVCAATSDFGYKVPSMGSWNDADVILNGWYEGVADDQF